MVAQPDVPLKTIITAEINSIKRKKFLIKEGKHKLFYKNEIGAFPKIPVKVACSFAFLDETKGCLLRNWHHFI